MKYSTCLVSFFLLFGIPWHTICQEVEISARGTGQTTGHIIDLTIENNTSEDVTLQLGPWFVPATESGEEHEQYQSYITTGAPRRIDLPAGENRTLPIEGFCTDITSPPVPSGVSMVPYSSWEPIDPERTSGPELVTVPDWIDHDTRARNPFTGASMPGGLNFEEHPEIAGPLIAESLDRIGETLDSLYTENAIRTPFSGDRERERETVLQQTLWIYTSDLSGKEYEREDFQSRLADQMLENMDIAYEELPEEEQENFDTGIDQFWSTFELVGTKAKVLEEEPGPEFQPEEEIEEEGSGCEEDLSIQVDPPFELDMEIAEEWGDEEEREEIRQNVEEALTSNEIMTNEESFEAYDINRHPTSSTSFWKSGQVGGFASAYAKTLFQRPNGSSEWVWGTDRMTTEADGTMEYSLTYTHDETCRSLVAGVAVVRIRASSSAFDAMAGNTQLENETQQLNFLRGTKYLGKKAMEWLILRGRGRTSKSFQKFVTDDLKDKVQGEIEEVVEEEAIELAEQHLNALLEELGLDLSLSDIEMPDFELPNLKDMIEEAFGIDIQSIDEFISDGLDAFFNLFFVANTYATANGSLVVHVGGQSGSAQAHTSVHYSREAQEDTRDAMRWSGEDCEETTVSDAQANSLTIRTIGSSNMVAEAMSRYGFGNGQAEAFLESMNLQVLTGICICPAQRMGEESTYNLVTDGNLGWYTAEEGHQQAIQNSLGPLLDSINEDLLEELNGMSEQEVNNLSADQFKSMVLEKVQDWADDHPYAWEECR